MAGVEAIPYSSEEPSRGETKIHREGMDEHGSRAHGGVDEAIDQIVALLGHAETEILYGIRQRCDFPGSGLPAYLTHLPISMMGVSLRFEANAFDHRFSQGVCIIRLPVTQNGL